MPHSTEHRKSYDDIASESATHYANHKKAVKAREDLETFKRSAYDFSPDAGRRYEDSTRYQNDRMNADTGMAASNVESNNFAQQYAAELGAIAAFEDFDRNPQIHQVPVQDESSRAAHVPVHVEHSA